MRAPAAEFPKCRKKTAEDLACPNPFRLKDNRRGR
jgi:hypothetical protein